MQIVGTRSAEGYYLQILKLKLIAGKNEESKRKQEHWIAPRVQQPDLNIHEAKSSNLAKSSHWFWEPSAASKPRATEGSSVTPKFNMNVLWGIPGIIFQARELETSAARLLLYK